MGADIVIAGRWMARMQIRMCHYAQMLMNPAGWYLFSDVDNV